MKGTLVATSISFEELDGFAGEVLPERAVMSTVVTPIVTPNAAPNAAPYGGGYEGGATVVSACQSTNTLATGGLVGALGLSPNAQQTNLQCTPAAVSG